MTQIVIMLYEDTTKVNNSDIHSRIIIISFNTIIIFTIASNLIQTICFGSLHLCRIATTVMSYICCTLYCLAGSCSSL